MRPVGLRVYMTAIAIFVASLVARIIHEGFYCNRRHAAATGLAAGFTRPSGRARHSGPQHTVSSMPRALVPPRARLAWRLRGSSRSLMK